MHTFEELKKFCSLAISLT